MIWTLYLSLSLQAEVSSTGKSTWDSEHLFPSSTIIGAMIWRTLGRLTSAVAAFGLGQPVRKPNVSNSPNPPPSFLTSQLRKRTFASCFIVDKLLATFYGRPPTLSRIYFSSELPLDLNDEELQGNSEEMLLLLDANGWAKSGVISQTTFLRALMMSSQIRDEILELSLSSPSPSFEQHIK